MTTDSKRPFTVMELCIIAQHWFLVTIESMLRLAENVKLQECCASGECEGYEAECEHLEIRLERAASDVAARKEALSRATERLRLLSLCLSSKDLEPAFAHAETIAGIKPENGMGFPNWSYRNFLEDRSTVEESATLTGSTELGSTAKSWNVFGGLAYDATTEEYLELIRDHWRESSRIYHDFAVFDGSPLETKASRDDLFGYSAQLALRAEELAKIVGDEAAVNAAKEKGTQDLSVMFMYCSSIFQRIDSGDSLKRTLLNYIVSDQ